MLSSDLAPRIPQVETLHYKSVLVRLMWIELQIEAMDHLPFGGLSHMIHGYTSWDYPCL